VEAVTVTAVEAAAEEPEAKAGSDKKDEGFALE